MDPFAGKPSKEQLETYFKMSRQYFDQIAKQYYETDRAYYDKMIAPFYGPFSSISSGAAKTGRRAAGVLIGALLLVMGLGAGIFILTTMETSPGGEDSDPVEEIETIEEPASSDYDEGVLYFNQKEYERAELYFKKVGKDDDHYESAQQYLQEIKVLKEQLQKEKKPGSNRRNTRAPKTYSPR
jgi:tetratricopeptide (TPR) repeat protein